MPLYTNSFSMIKLFITTYIHDISSKSHIMFQILHIFYINFRLTLFLMNYFSFLIICVALYIYIYFNVHNHDPLQPTNPTSYTFVYCCFIRASKHNSCSIIQGGHSGWDTIVILYCCSEAGSKISWHREIPKAKLALSSELALKGLGMSNSTSQQ